MENKTAAINWLRRAKSNLIRAMMEKTDDIFWEDLCFDAQQAAEKALKALLIFEGIKFRFVHDIGELIYTLEKNDISVPDKVKESVILTDYAVEKRYPFLSQPVKEEDYNKAIEVSEKVYNWVADQIDPQLSLNLN